MRPIEIVTNRELDRRTIVGFGLLIGATVTGIFVAVLLWNLFAPVVGPLVEQIPPDIRSAILPVILITGVLVAALYGLATWSQRRARARVLTLGRTEGWTLDIALGSFSKFWSTAHEHLPPSWVRTIQRSNRAVLIVPADTKIIGPKELWGARTRAKHRTRPGERVAGPAQALAEAEGPAMRRLLRKMASGGTEPALAFVTLGCGEGFTGLTRAIVLAKEILGLRPRMVVLTIVIDRSQLNAAAAGPTSMSPASGSTEAANAGPARATMPNASNS